LVLDERPDTPVIAGLAGLREKTTRQFAILAMIRHTLAAHALARAGLVSAGAGMLIFIFAAIHGDYSI
jgi:hypothetical protein